MTNKVAIILGSENDKKYVEDSYKYFEYFGIGKPVAAHQTGHDPTAQQHLVHSHLLVR